MRGWARPTLVWQEAEGVFDEPCAVFDTTDATDIVSIACLRVLRSGIQDSEVSDVCVREGLVDRLYGGTALEGRGPKVSGGAGQDQGQDHHLHAHPYLPCRR